MRNLLSAGIARLKKEKIFWLGILFMFGLGIFVTLMKYSDVVRYQEKELISDTLLIYMQFIGCCGAVFCSIFIGTEYSDGTIRNKLVVGHSRWAIYGANLLLSICAVVLMALSYLASYVPLGIFLLGSSGIPAGIIASHMVLSLFTIVAYVSLFQMLSMLITKKSTSAVACLLIFFGLLMLAMIIISRLDAPEYISGYSLTVNGVEQTEPELNPKYLQPAARKVYQFFLDLLPSGQGLQISAFQVTEPVRVLLLSLGISIVTTATGIFAFRKKDLK